MSARFRIRVATWPTSRQIILADRWRPAFFGQYSTIEAACRAMDNIIRREKGMPERIGISPIEVQAEMSRRRANLLAGKVPHAAPVRPEHYGQHLQGCVSCYDYVEAAPVREIRA